MKVKLTESKAFKIGYIVLFTCYLLSLIFNNSIALAITHTLVVAAMTTVICDKLRYTYMALYDTCFKKWQEAKHAKKYLRVIKYQVAIPCLVIGLTIVALCIIYSTYEVWSAVIE